VWLDRTATRAETAIQYTSSGLFMLCAHRYLPRSRNTAAGQNIGAINEIKPAAEIVVSSHSSLRLRQ
jgi:hypothetical protein